MALGWPVRRAESTRTLAAAALAAVVALLAASGADAAIVAQPLCPPPPAGHARCAAEILVDTATGAAAHPADLTAKAPTGDPAHPAGLTGSAAPQTGSPAWLQWAYDLQGLSAARPECDRHGRRRRPVRRRRRGVRPRHLPLELRLDGMHDRQRLLQEGRPERRDQLPARSGP